MEKTKCSFFLSTAKARTVESQPSDTSKLVTQMNDLKAVVTSAHKFPHSNIIFTSLPSFLINSYSLNLLQNLLD